jgi:integrase
MRVNIVVHPTLAGAYYLEYRPNGSKGKKERVKAIGYEKACALRDQIEDRYNSPTRRIDTHPRIKDVYDAYLAWVKDNQADATYKNKEIVFRAAIIPHFGDYRVKDLSQTVYDEFHKKYTGKRKAIILYQAYLGALIKWMNKRGMGPKLDFTPEKPVWNSPVRTIPHPSDMDRVFAAITDPIKRLIFQLMLLSGMRWNETINIRWEQVDIKAGSIRLVESEQEQNDIVPIPESLLDWFKTNRQLGSWVFPNPKTGEPYGSLKKILQKACTDTGVRMFPHLFRHASATYLYAATGDIKAVQAHLRQKDIRSTLIYIKYSIDQVKTGQKALVLHMEGMKKKAKGKNVGHMANSKKAVNP